MSDFFASFGALLGEIIRIIVDFFTGFFSDLADSGQSFLRGLSRSLGIAPSLINLLVIVLGLWMLWKALRAFMRRALFVGGVWLVLGVVLLSWLIN